MLRLRAETSPVKIEEAPVVESHFRSDLKRMLIRVIICRFRETSKTKVIPEDEIKIDFLMKLLAALTRLRFILPDTFFAPWGWTREKSPDTESTLQCLFMSMLDEAFDVVVERMVDYYIEESGGETAAYSIVHSKSFPEIMEKGIMDGLFYPHDKKDALFTRYKDNWLPCFSGKQLVFWARCFRETFLPFALEKNPCFFYEITRMYLTIIRKHLIVYIENMELDNDLDIETAASFLVLRFFDEVYGGDFRAFIFNFVGIPALNDRNIERILFSDFINFIEGEGKALFNRVVLGENTAVEVK